MIVVRISHGLGNQMYQYALLLSLKKIYKDISTTMEIYAEATKEAKAHSFANLNGKLGISV